MENEKSHTFTIVILVVMLLGLIATLFYLNKKLTTVETSLSSLHASFENFKLDTEQLEKEQEQKLVELSDSLYKTQNVVSEVGNEFYDYKGQIGQLSGTVETLEKLSTTDPELLQKYSKVYFLNEHYMPANLKVIDKKYDFDNEKEVTVHAKVWPHLKELLEEAHEDGIELQVLSGYRSFEEQETLKNTYTVQYGVGANKFSADQGYSEHQLGTTVDFTTPEIGSNLDLLEQTSAYEWLIKNAYKYGFTMSYPENNEYYQYEPWHWRFVGEDLAGDLHQNDKYFYDLEQREIDTYIPELFD